MGVPRGTIFFELFVCGFWLLLFCVPLLSYCLVVVLSYCRIVIVFVFSCVLFSRCLVVVFIVPRGTTITFQGKSLKPICQRGLFR